MATTITNEESTYSAPTDFNLSEYFDDLSLHGTIRVAYEKCNLCGDTKRSFTCKDCINKGDFFHSHPKHPSNNSITGLTLGNSNGESERYVDKHKRWQILKNERIKILQRFQENVAGRVAQSQKKTELRFREERVHLLKQALKTAKSQEQLDKEELGRLKERNVTRVTESQRHKEKTIKKRRYLEQLRLHTEKRHEELEECIRGLCRIRGKHLEDLMRYIFPISEVQARSEADAQNTVSALAEARHTAYIRGRWIYTDSDGEYKYRIVEPTLPGSGDYSVHNIWLMENREALPSAQEYPGQRNPAYTIAAALSHCAQLMSLLAYFLDVNLPKRQTNSDFCLAELTEKQFNRAVCKLNHNVLHLCLSQHVDLQTLQPKQTIHNILELLRSSTLGRASPFRVHTDIMESLYESCQLSQGELDLSSSEDEDDHWDPDWERIPVSLPDSAMTSTTTDSYVTSTTQDASGLTGTLMSSAAASVVSLWRGAWGRKDSS